MAPPRQKTFTVIPNPLGMQGLQSRSASNPPPRAMTTKQIQAEYRKKNRVPRISKAEQRRRDMEEREQMRKEAEKDKAANKARMAREKKKEAEQVRLDNRRKAGLPLVDVRPSQGTISWYVKPGTKRKAEEEQERQEVEEEVPTKIPRTSWKQSEEEEEIRGGYAGEGPSDAPEVSHESSRPEPRSKLPMTNGLPDGPQGKSVFLKFVAETAAGNAAKTEATKSPSAMVSTRAPGMEVQSVVNETPVLQERLPAGAKLNDQVGPETSSTTTARLGVNPKSSVGKPEMSPHRSPRVSQPPRSTNMTADLTAARSTGPANSERADAAISMGTTSVVQSKTPQVVPEIGASPAKLPRPSPSKERAAPAIPTHAVAMSNPLGASQQPATTAHPSHPTHPRVADTAQAPRPITPQPRPQEPMSIRKPAPRPLLASASTIYSAAKLQSHAVRFKSAQRTAPSKQRSMAPHALPPPFKEPEVTSADRAGPKFLPNRPSVPSLRKPSSSQQKRPEQQQPQPAKTAASALPTSTQLFLLSNFDEILPSATQEARELQLETQPKAPKTAPQPRPKPLMAPPPAPRAPNSVRPRQLTRQTAHVLSGPPRTGMPPQPKVLAPPTTMGPPDVPKPPVPAPRMGPPARPRLQAPLATPEPFVPFLSTQDLLLSTQDILEVEDNTDTPSRPANKSWPSFRKPLQEVSNVIPRGTAFMKPRVPSAPAIVKPMARATGRPHPPVQKLGTNPTSNENHSATATPRTTSHTSHSRSTSQHLNHRSSKPLQASSSSSSLQSNTSHPPIRHSNNRSNHPSENRLDKPIPRPASPPPRAITIPTSPGSHCQQNSAHTSQTSSSSPEKPRFFTSSGTTEMVRLAEERSRRTFREEQRKREMQAAEERRAREEAEKKQAAARQKSQRGSDHHSDPRGEKKGRSATLSASTQDLRMLETLVDDIDTDEALLAAGKSFGSMCGSEKEMPEPMVPERANISVWENITKSTTVCHPGNTTRQEAVIGWMDMSQETDYGDFEASQVLRVAERLF